MKKFVGILLSMLMILSLTGCSMDMGSLFSKKPQNAEQLLEKVETCDNANVDMAMTINMKMAAQGVSMEIPIKFNINMDMAGDYGHGNMNMSMSFMGQSEDIEAEMYYADGYCYYYDEDSDSWYKTEADSMPMMTVADGDKQKLDPKYFEGAEFAYDKDSEVYMLKQSMAQFMQSDEANSAILDSMGSSFDNDMVEEMMEQLGEGTVVYTFDKTYHLIGLYTEDCAFTQKSDEYDLSVEYDIEMNLTDINKISEDDVKIPKSVKKDAIEKDGDMFDLDGSDTDLSNNSGDDNDYGWGNDNSTDNGTGADYGRDTNNTGDDDDDDWGSETGNDDWNNTPTSEQPISTNGSTNGYTLKLSDGSITVYLPSSWDIYDSENVICAYVDDYSLNWSDSYIKVNDVDSIKRDWQYDKENNNPSDVYTFTINGRESYAYYSNVTTDFSKYCVVHIYVNIGTSNYVGNDVQIHGTQLTSESQLKEIVETFALGSGIEYK